ncbi:MAG: MFS transporter, partial [Chloroflexi bacterium]|nr:MFS transporter [Chloroflexota bacterium]
GLGFGLFSSPNTNAVMGGVDKSRYGVAAAILGTMRHTGQVLSLAIALLIFALFIGHVPITPQNHGALMTSARTGFGLFALLSMTGVMASLKRGTVRGGSQKLEVRSQ